VPELTDAGNTVPGGCRRGRTTKVTAVVEPHVGAASVPPVRTRSTVPNAVRDVQRLVVAGHDTVDVGDLEPQIGPGRQFGLHVVAVRDAGGGVVEEVDLRSGGKAGDGAIR
jgi:hypothetical protein